MSVGRACPHLVLQCMHALVGWYVCTSRILPTFVYSCFKHRFFSLYCFKPCSAAVGLIAIVHIHSIFEIHIFCCEMCEYDSYSVFFANAVRKGNSMTAEVLQRAAEINGDTVMATNQYRINVLAKTEIHPGGFTADI